MRISELGSRTGKGAAIAAMLALLTAGGVAAADEPNIDPPGFAPVTLHLAQAIRLNVTCFEHDVGAVEPSRCTGELMFHDAKGRELKRQPYALEPGRTTFLQMPMPLTNAAGDRIRSVLVIPCVIPGPGGLAIPSVEVFDRVAGHMVLFENPAAARMSDFGPAPPGSERGFDPQPDPPGFGAVTLRGDQGLRMNVFCFGHAVNGSDPEPCQGSVMFHDAAGDVLRRATYDLDPGEASSFELPPRPLRGGVLVGIIPCFIPEPGGRAVPNVEVLGFFGNVSLLINPAVAAMSEFQLQPIR